jgi:hypothetical protein
MESTAHRQHKRKKKKKAKQIALYGEDFDDERGLNMAVGRMGSQELADYIGSCTQRFLSQASAVELDDLTVEGSLGQYHNSQDVNRY